MTHASHMVRSHGFRMLITNSSILTPIPRTYPDPDPGYEATHKPPTSATPRYPIKPVLSPGTTHRARWTIAIQALISVLGQDAVLIDSALSGRRNRLPWFHGPAERYIEDRQELGIWRTGTESERFRGAGFI
ncbi:hypothetical protein QR685DRAFT_594131 [Neurospora intermedia]|uniref:Uncharacterized protein n=1 Tax=Neurospora intermedia TaxID=5142 RepID=A0ABR3DSE6_NEUIN